MVAPNLFRGTSTLTDATGKKWGAPNNNQMADVIEGIESTGMRIQANVIEHNQHSFDITVYINAADGKIYARRSNGTVITSGLANTAADVAAVIQAALDGLTAGRTNKESILIKSGAYTTNARLDISSYTQLLMEGGALIKLADSITAAAIIRNKNYGVSVDSDIDIVGGTLDGNKAGLAQSNCLVLGGVVNCSVSHLTAKNAGGASGRNIYIVTENALRVTEKVRLVDITCSGATDSDLEIAGNADGGAALIRRVELYHYTSDSPGHRNLCLTNAHKCVASGLELFDATTHAIDLSYNSTDNVISEFYAEGADMAGVNVNSLNSSHNTFSKFRIHACGTFGFGTTATFLNISDGLITNCGQDGIRLAAGSDWSSITNVHCLNNSQTPANTYTGINIQDSANCTISNCILTDTQTTKTQRWGVALNAGTSGNKLINNQVIGNLQAAGISDSGTGNIIYTPTIKEFAVVVRINGTNIEAISGITGEIISVGTDAATVINAGINALAATGGILTIREGTFTINATLVRKSNMVVDGAGWNQTILSKNFNGTLWYWDGNSNMIVRNLKIDGRRAAGITGRGIQIFTAAGGNDNTIENVFFTGFENTAVEIRQDRNYVNNCRIEDSAQNAIWLVGNATTQIRKCEINNVKITNFGQVTAVNAETAGIRFDDTIGCVISGGVIETNTTGGKHAVYIRGTAGKRNRVIGVMVDGSAHPTLPLNADVIRFENTDNIIGLCTIINAAADGIGCTSTAHGTIAFGNQCLDNDLNGIEFNGCNDSVAMGNICKGTTVHAGMYIAGDRNTIVGNVCNDNFRDGINLNDNGAGGIANDCVVVGNQTWNNNRSAAAGYSGIRLVSTNDSIIAYNRAGDNQVTKTQNYGLFEQTAAARNIIQGNNVRDNINAAGISAIGTTDSIRDNVGFNPQGCVAIDMTGATSPYTYTNNDNVPEAIYINGGTVTDITKNGVSVGIVSDRTILLEPTESVTVTYTTAPSIIKDRK